MANREKIGKKKKKELSGGKWKWGVKFNRRLCQNTVCIEGQVDIKKN